MSLEDAMNNLAAAMNKYSDTVEKYGGQLLNSLGAADAGAAEGKTAPAAEDKAPAQGQGGRPKKDDAKKPEPAADADDDDGFGDEDSGKAEEALDFATVKAKLLEVRDVTGDKSHALKIIEKNGGYKALTEIQEKDFRKIYDAACKVIADHE